MINWTLRVFVLASLVACGGDDDDNGDTDTGVDTDTPGTTDTAPVAFEDDIVSTWVSSECEAWPLPDGTTAYQLRTYEFMADGTYNQIARSYADPGCGAVLFNFRSTGAYTIVGESASVDGGYELTLDRTTLYATAEAVPAVDVFTQAYCGDGTWEVGVEEEITDTGCLGFLPSAACPTAALVFAIDGDNLMVSNEMDPAACDPTSFATELMPFTLARQ